jgi:hypothetical protein
MAKQSPASVQSSRVQSSRSKQSSQKQSPRSQASSQAALTDWDLPLWSVAVLAALTTLLFFRSQIFGSAYFWEDFTEYVYPAQSFAARALQAGELPFWNPYTFSGIPFLADVAIAFFYPVNWLQSLFVANGRLPVIVAELVIILHFWLAQMTMFALVRSFNVSSLGSLIAAVSYGFCGMMVCHVFHPMMVAHFTWFPLVWMLFARVLDDLSLKAALLAGLVYGVMLLSGHPQTSLYLTLLLFFYTLWMGAVKLRDRTLQGSSILVFSTLAALPILIGAGLFAVQLLHSQEFAAVSVRQNFSVEQASAGSLQWKQVFALIVPKLFGAVDAASLRSSTPELPYYIGQYYDYWETCCYFGIVALVLGKIGFAQTLRTGQHRHLARFLCFAAIFGLLFAVGSHGFLFGAMFQLPLFGTFRIPARMMIFLVLAFSIMAGIGFDEVVKKEMLNNIAPRTVLFITGVIALLALVAAVGVVQSFSDAPKEVLSATQQQAFIALVLVLIVGLLAWLAARGVIAPRVAGMAFVVIAVLDLNVQGASFNASKNNPEEAYRLPPAIEEQLTAKPPQSLFRVRTREAGFTAMQRNQGLMSPIMMYEGYTPITLARLLPAAPNADAMFDLLNVRYEIALNRSTGEAGFRERPTYLPRARMVYRAVQATPETAKQLGSAPTMDVVNSVVVEKPLATPLGSSGAATVSHNVECVHFSANESTYNVTTSANGVLVFSEIWYPAWRVSIDGQPAELLRVNHSLRGVVVPAGRHTVRMWYDSTAFRTGAWISCVTLVTTLAGLVVVIVLERRSGAGTAAE